MLPATGLENALPQCFERRSSVASLFPSTGEGPDAEARRGDVLGASWGWFNIFSNVDALLSLRVFGTFRPSGIVLGGTHVRIDTLIGNAIFYKSLEGFLESLPQSIYQTSIVIRQGVDISKK